MQDTVKKLASMAEELHKLVENTPATSFCRVIDEANSWWG